MAGSRVKEKAQTTQRKTGNRTETTGGDSKMPGLQVRFRAWLLCLTSIRLLGRPLSKPIFWRTPNGLRYAHHRLKRKSTHLLHTTLVKLSPFL